MIKSVNQLVTEKCNSRCKMCSIWSIKNRCSEMTSVEFDKLYSKSEFKEVEDLCISGGEATLRRDLFKITDSILKNLPKLKMLFLCTNGSNPKVARKFIKKYASKVKDIYICPSLEGSKDTHRKIRGVDSYNQVLETAKLVKELNLENSHIIFSATIVPENCNKKDLNHIKKLAKGFNCTFSFRPASQNDTLYHNRRFNKFMITSNQLQFLKEYMAKEKISDSFLDILFKSIEGKETIMGSRKNGINCLAGDISVFIKPNGDIFPCINSSRLIGNKKRGIFRFDYKLGDKELCPCCTECQIYPMLNFFQYSTKSNMKVNVRDYKLVENSFGYLMYLLYKNEHFSELHLPSLNLIKRDTKKIRINKKVPIEFKLRIKEIESVAKYSKKTNIKIRKKFFNDKDLILTLTSKIGETLDVKKLATLEKRRILDLFFEYHDEINNPKINLNTDYHSFFNIKKFKKDISLLKKKISSKDKSQFDKQVLNFIKLIYQQEKNVSYKNFKKRNVHGDFSLRNIIQNEDGLSLIDLDMLHKGYLEIQLMKLLRELFGFSTKEFFENLNFYYNRLSLNKTKIRKLFEIYLNHEILDLSVIKSAYFTNKTKYLELQEYIIPQIDFITNLINRKKEFLKIFEVNLER